MQKKQLFINDQEVDLNDDSPIGLTFQINDLGEVQNQQGNTSNQFTLPSTQKNRRILGFPEDIATCQKVPYQRNTALYKVSGVEVFANAIAEVASANEQTIALTLLSGNVDFFDLLGGQIADMGDSTSQWSGYGQNLVWKPYDHLWNLVNAANSQKKTKGWIYPVVDYGLLTADFSAPIDVHNMRPGFFIKTAIDLLIKSTGYLAKGSMFKNPLYPLLIAQFSNTSWDHGIDYQNQPDKRGMDASLAQYVQVNHPTVLGNIGTIVFPNVITNPSNLYDPATGIYTANEIITVTVKLKIPSFFFAGHIDNTYGSNVDINIMYTDPVNGDLVLAGINFDLSNNPTKPNPSFPIGYVSTLNQILSFQTELPVGGKIRITYEFKGYTQSSFTMAAGAELTIKADNQQVLFGQEVQCEKILPDTSEKDFLKDTLQRFGIICQTDVYSKTITFSSLKDIVSNIPIAKDWSKKCLDQGKDVSYILSDNFAQVNYLKYQTDGNGGTTFIPPKFGWSKILVNNKTLSVYPTDLIVSIFGPSLNRPFYGGSTALIEMVDPTSGSNDFSISVTPRILISNKVDLIKLGKTVHFTDDPTGDLTDPAHNIFINDVIDCPYFFKPGGQYSLMWDDLKLMSYQELQAVLKDTKKVIRYFLLTEQDIKELNLLIPIFVKQDSCYYYINNIENWQDGVPTKCTVIKLG